MNLSRLFATVLCCISSAAALSQTTVAPGRAIPEALKPWVDWALWDDRSRLCPAPWNDPAKPLCIWPGRLALEFSSSGGAFQIEVETFSETWVPLPGGAATWPQKAASGEVPLAVVEREGRPSVRLSPGRHRISGSYTWRELPQRIAIPPEIGILSLSIEGQPVPLPVWDAQGFLWLKRDASDDEADQEFLSAKAYAVLEDGIPMWLRTEIELTVSGKSREEEIGLILPAGWKLAALENPIPVAIDDAGRMKAQVRAGQWTIRVDAFRFDNPKEFAFPAQGKRVASEWLVALRAKPDFRLIEIRGATAIDVAQTTFPEKWRSLPVYLWAADAPLAIEERLRGLGEQQPAGLHIQRQWWLDEDGGGLTFRDSISGTQQRIWRLDAAPGQALGAVKAGGQPQLITRNPASGAPGIELRARDLNLEATGRMPRAAKIPASGWLADAESLSTTLELPPGWRLFAAFGADSVEGDWLTAWTLLDLFLLLIFSLAVLRLWGLPAALLAFAAFGLSYHESMAPRYTWLALLAPLALLRVVPAGWGQRILRIAKWTAIAALLLVLVPFAALQIQQAIYPQLEAFDRQMPRPSLARTETSVPGLSDATPATAAPSSAPYDMFRKALPQKMAEAKAEASKQNLAYDSAARIQAGPGVPDWSWRQVTFSWNSPVAPSQEIRPVLISRGFERLLSLLRVALVIALAAVLLDARRWPLKVFRTAAPAAALWLLLAVFPTKASAQWPEPELIETLRKRLLETPDAFPNAADIPSATLSLDGQRLRIAAEIHMAVRAAVPIPARLPAWSPVAVMVDGKPAAALRRGDAHLWVVLDPGVRRIDVEGLLPEASEWEWTFLLKPRRVAVDAPGWTVSGTRPDGSPEGQVFLVRQQQEPTPGAAAYDRPDLQAAVLVERQIELGLVWRVQTTVSRLSSPGKAVALRIPLLAGENVVSGGTVVREGAVEVRLGAQEQGAAWQSDLPIGGGLALATREGDGWIERWRLVASPIWNVALTGLPPVFDAASADLLPMWHPWPGETAALSISRPEAIAGPTVAIDRATQNLALGRRQRTAQLELNLRASVGQDFPIELPANAEITSLTHQGQMIPARQDGSKLIIPVRPGDQTISVAWKINAPLAMASKADPVRLPVETANAEVAISVPEERWVLWTHGPTRGPAVRFWTILASALIAAFVLGRLTASPLKTHEWMLLGIGLTQVPVLAALAVVAWLFLLAWRGRDSFQKLAAVAYNLAQVFLALSTFVALCILLAAVGAGLLGSPEMFIRGNDSTRTLLRWFQARCEDALPTPGCVSISIWWYRLLMLAWALWLAAALIRWLGQGWRHFSSGGLVKRSDEAQKQPAAPPPLPAKP
jgi:hypothetical protein